MQGYLATVDMFPAFRRLEIVSSAFPWFSCPGFLGRRGGVSDKGAPGSLDGDRGPPNSQQAHVFLQLRDCGGLREVEVTACLVWKDWPHRVHPHSLVGKDCTDGVCRVRLRPHVSPRHRYQTLTSDPSFSPLLIEIPKVNISTWESPGHRRLGQSLPIAHLGWTGKVRRGQCYSVHHTEHPPSTFTSVPYLLFILLFETVSCQVVKTNLEFEPLLPQSL